MWTYSQIFWLEMPVWPCDAKNIGRISQPLVLFAGWSWPESSSRKVQKHQLVTTITAMIITGSPDQPRWWAEDRAWTWKSDKSEKLIKCSHLRKNMLWLQNLPGELEGLTGVENVTRQEPMKSAKEWLPFGECGSCLSKHWARPQCLGKSFPKSRPFSSHRSSNHWWLDD